MSTETVDTALAIRTWTEAPASLNIKVNLAGYDVMLTLSGDSAQSCCTSSGARLRRLAIWALCQRALRRARSERTATVMVIA